MPYCPYTDRDLEPAETNPEHIIPLSLGGSNQFQIPVCKEANSNIGSKIDGAMASDFVAMTMRDRYDVRGHSGKEPIFVAKDCFNPDGKALQVGFGQRTGLEVWSPRDKEYIRDERAKTFTVNFSIDMAIALQFTAKVALSAGYFAYGDLFRRQVKHQDFRTIMNNRVPSSEDLQGMEALAFDRFSDDKSDQLQLFRAMCAAAEPRSLVALVPGPDHFAVVVGLLGDFVGMISVPATTAGFPNERAFRAGHVMVPQKGGLARLPFQEALRQLAEKLTSPA